MSFIEVVKKADDGLSDRLWRFWVRIPFNSHTASVELCYFAERKREARRGKMKAVRFWEKTRPHDSSIKPIDVPFNHEIANDAAARLVVSVRDALGVEVQREAWANVQPN